MGIKIGLDIGGSTTKIVGIRDNGIFYTSIVRSDDPVASAAGAVGKLISDNNLAVSDIDCIYLTGVGSGYSDNPILGIRTVKIEEFTAIATGGLYVSGKDHAVIVSMGTGTAILEAVRKDGKILARHIIGSGVGGGTLVGLCNSAIGIDDPKVLARLADEGDAGKADLTIADITDEEIPGLPLTATASNFGKAADGLDREDIAAAVFNMVHQVIGCLAVVSARSCGISDIVLTGQLTGFNWCRKTAEDFSSMYGVDFQIPANAVYSTAIGAYIAGREDSEA
ncbi:MAG: pantothenate kinase [Clostridiales bacterium]|nr:pantothenate kinase [Clostridiales bacterium]